MKLDLPELFPDLKRQLEGGAAQMIGEDDEVVGVDERVFGRALEEIVGVFDDVLVEGAGAGNENRQRGLLAASGAARLLPGAGNRAGEAGDHAGLKLADVDAQFQRVRGHHRPHLARPQARFDGAAFGGEIAAAVAAEFVRVATGVAHGIAQIGEQQFGAQPRTGEKDGLHVVVEQAFADFLRFQQAAAPQAQFGIDEGRVVEEEVLFAGGRAIFVDEGDGRFDQAVGVFGGVGDGGRGEDEVGISAVEAADAAQAADHVGHVRAEHAAVGVDFVDDDDAQAAEKLGPVGVVRQDAGVQHVGVAEQQSGAFADAFALALRRVAVVGRHGHIRLQGLDQRSQLGQLVVGQGFGGEEVEGAGVGIVEQAVQDGQVVAQGFARGGGRDDDDVFAAQGRLHRHAPDGCRAGGCRGHAAPAAGADRDRQASARSGRHGLAAVPRW